MSTTTTNTTTTPGSVPTLAPISTSAPAHPLESPGLESRAAEAVPASGGAVMGGSNTPPEPMVHVRALVISGQNHVFNFEPELTVGRMKELIWSMWPSDWTEPTQPPSPSYLRILHAGRILQDDTTLTSNNLPVSPSVPTNPTVIHISVRSFSIRAEDDPKKGSNLHPTRTRSRAGDEEVGGCKCIIM